MDRSRTTGNARRRVAGLAITAIVAALLAPLAASPAAAQPVPPVTYSPGDIDGQNGWAGSGIGINDSIDQAVVVNSGAPAEFAAQSWRISNASTNGSFGDHPFSPSVADEAGETDADGGGLSGGTRQTSFSAQWDFSSADPSAEQPGLGITVSPDRGDGARMSWVRMEDTPSGLQVLFNDYQQALDPGCASSGDLGFAQTTIATGLARAAAHTARIEMDFVDGPANDVVRVYVDGALVHTGTSWEDYFRDCEGNETRTVDSLLFQSRGTAAPATDGNGFLIDNVAISTGVGSELSTGFEAILSTTTTEVYAIDDVDWYAADTRPGGTLAFSENHGSTLGDGAAVLSTNATGAAKVQLFTDLFGTVPTGTPLADIDGLSYSTYRVTAPPGSPALPALNLRVDTDNDGAVDSYLVYEPYQDLGNGAVLDLTWQTWDAIRGGDAKWWVSHPAQFGGQCGQALPCTWDTILGLAPNAKVLEDPDSPINSLSAPPGPLNGSLGVNLGSGNPSVTGAVDGLTVNVNGDQQIFDFEAIFVPDAPTNLTATPDGDGDVDLSWDAPAEDGGRPITGYHVYRDGTEIGTTDELTTTFTDDAVLASSNLYAYTVTAENEIGESDESNTATADVNLFWKGFEWDVLNGEAAINGDDEAELTRFGPGESWIRIVGPPPVVAGDTPWAEFSYEDDGTSYQGVDMFIDSMGAAPNPRVQVGSLFTAELLGYARYTDAGTPAEDEVIVFAESDTVGAGPRTPGAHTIYVGETSGGRIDYQADGTWYTTDYLIGHGTPFEFNDILLRWRCRDFSLPAWAVACSGGETVTFTDFVVGDDHDETPPEITLTTPVDGAVYAVDEVVTADYECTDTQSTVTTCDGDLADGATLDTSTPGDHSFTVDAEDEVGNTSTLTHDYTVLDVTDPVVTIVTPPDGAFYYQGEHVVADFTCEEEPEPGSSDLISCDATEDGAPVSDGDPLDTVVPGPHAFTVTAEDGDGNVTEVTNTYTVDVTDPTITITTPADGGAYDRGDEVPADFGCTDPGGSGIATCIGTVPNGVNLDTTDLGTFNFIVFAIDNVGNISVLSHTYTVVDGTPPTVTISAPGDGVTYTLGESVEADFSCEDEPGGSGLDTCVGTLANGALIDTSTIGDFEFEVTGTDNAGNAITVTNAYSVAAAPDVDGPEITITTPPDGAVYEIGQVVTVDYACTDPSGVDSCVGDLADGATLDTTTVGDYTFTVDAEDNEANPSTLTHNYRVRENTDPTVTIDSPEDGDVYGQGDLVIADYTCEDELGGSGIASCVGPVDDGDPVDTSVPGEHEFTVVGTDNDGNETEETVTYTVDDSAPTITITTPEDGGEYNRNEVVAADYSCTDTGGSTVVTCFGTVPDGVNITTSTLGDHNFSVFAVDAVGNLTVSVATYAVVDGTAPSVTITSPEDGETFQVGEVVLADFSCEDEVGGSGIDTCEGTVDDGDALDTDTAGDFELTVTAMDDDGNTTVLTHDFRVVARPLCRGESVTVDLGLGEVPTGGPDVIRGTPGADTINALGGDDVVCGLDGNDAITLGGGNDIADGGAKADRLFGNAGNDTFYGGNGNDVVTAHAGDDVLNGGDGLDQLGGSAGADRLIGGARRDTCDGGADIDTARQCEVKANIP